MQSPEYGEILTSLQEVVRKAYVLGRSEALKQVIDVMQKDETTWKPLALTGPADHASATALGSVETPAQETGSHDPAGHEPGAREPGARDVGAHEVSSQSRNPTAAGDTTAWWTRPGRKLPTRTARAS